MRWLLLGIAAILMSGCGIDVPSEFTESEDASVAEAIEALNRPAFGAAAEYVEWIDFATTPPTVRYDDGGVPGAINPRWEEVSALLATAELDTDAICEGLRSIAVYGARDDSLEALFNRSTDAHSDIGLLISFLNADAMRLASAADAKLIDRLVAMLDATSGGTQSVWSQRRNMGSDSEAVLDAMVAIGAFRTTEEVLRRTHAQAPDLFTDESMAELDRAASATRRASETLLPLARAASSEDARATILSFPSRIDALRAELQSGMKLPNVDGSTIETIDSLDGP